MPDAARYALHRPEIREALDRGEAAILNLMGPTPQVFSAGQTVIGMEEEHETVHRLRTGWLARTRRLPDGRNQIIAVFLPGDLFGIKTMFMVRQPDAVEAITDATIDRVEQERLRAMMAHDFDVTLRVIWQVIEDERRLHAWVVGLGNGNAEERVAQMLLEFRGRLARSGHIAPDAAEYRLPMKHHHIADLLGITDVHVSRVLKHLREAEVACLERGTARLLDLRALERLARPVQDVFERASPEFGGGEREAT
ncbi:Crp/Fnr family transcriptional regulator [Methylorubrum rhodesianum]|uniref:Crp/Fnr family transcriptional regulator n=1 Tax=Methylorubrum rhodesianum TaxID=29427 RepID=UPI003CFD9B5F